MLHSEMEVLLAETDADALFIFFQEFRRSAGRYSAHGQHLSSTTRGTQKTLLAIVIFSLHGRAWRRLLAEDCITSTLLAPFSQLALLAMEKSCCF